ncbi:Tex family protein [Salegentibacter sediminis]|uniref:Tex family protein n=1 Tax=Salegentibacter sediminis TaxID=1930251 RepID=UPI0009BCC377|nr:Tex family protein [Salegentibacter sediminis]
MQLQEFLRSQLSLPEKSIVNTVALLKEDASIPFIARYRKEATGNLDEVAIEQIANLFKSFKDLDAKKQSVLKTIKEQGTLSSELEEKIKNARTNAEVEDLYLPFKKKRQTRADLARKAGLEGLAKIIMAQSTDNTSQLATRFLSEDFKSEEEVFSGARDIIAEWINENTYLRRRLRQMFSRNARIIAKPVKKEIENLENSKYSKLKNIDEPLNRIPSHRFLAVYRAEKLGLLKLKVEVNKEQAIQLITKIILKEKASAFSIQQIELAAEDAYKRLLKPSFSTEFLKLGKEKADRAAIEVFASNLAQLLMAPPLGAKRVLAIDPGFKSGCKLVCLDEQGSLLHNENIYPHAPQKQISQASAKIRSLVNAYKIEAIAIGNGTAARETELFVKKAGLSREVSVFMVNEAGASVYSASRLAREEFPGYDITVRGAVSIGRRLMDPLAELVKIEPRSIGVGQYQHEVDDKMLKEKLDAVVISCVNKVGVNVNTASKELLSYVSGIGPSLAKNIIEQRNKIGAFKSRTELLEVQRLGDKAYEQAAGFIRIKDGINPLDDSAVHPESYFIVEKMASNNGVEPEKLIGNHSILHKIKPEQYITSDLGLPTLKDILAELEKPGRDPRKGLSKFEFDPSIKSIDDLSPGMKLPGIVNNITNFGCFVDIGIKESGLIHISKLANEFVGDVNAIVKLNQHLEVTILDVDKEKKRIQLSLID